MGVSGVTRFAVARWDGHTAIDKAPAMQRPLRLTSVMGVARALLATISTEDAVDILVSEFGWDATFQACSLLRGPDADDAFAACWLHLLTDPIASELRHVPGLPTET